jgi:hypothetical protein
MKNFTLGLMGLTALSMGCADKDCGDTAGVGCDTGAEEADADADADATFAVTFSDTGVSVAVTNADMVGGYFFGMAETGAGDAGWYGEDCVTDGSICHDLYDSLSLTTVGAIGDIVANSTTLHSAAIESAVTYAFWGLDDADEYTDMVNCGGNDCAYYGG